MISGLSHAGHPAWDVADGEATSSLHSGLRGCQKRLSPCHLGALITGLAGTGTDSVLTHRTRCSSPESLILAPSSHCVSAAVPPLLPPLLQRGRDGQDPRVGDGSMASYDVHKGRTGSLTPRELGRSGLGSHRASGSCMMWGRRGGSNGGWRWPGERRGQLPAGSIWWTQHTPTRGCPRICTAGPQSP